MERVLVRPQICLLTTKSFMPAGELRQLVIERVRWEDERIRLRRRKHSLEKGLVSVGGECWEVCSLTPFAGCLCQSRWCRGLSGPWQLCVPDCEGLRSWWTSRPRRTLVRLTLRWSRCWGARAERGGEGREHSQGGRLSESTHARRD